MTLPPPHKTENLFRKYEPHIFSILINWPKSTTFKPDDVAVTTFAARLRDSISSVLEYQWTTSLDLDLLREIWKSELEITTPQGGIVLAKGRGKEATQAIAHTKIQETVSLSPSIKVNTPSVETLRCLAFLLGEKTLTTPVHITNADQTILQNIAENYNVAFVQEKDYIIML